MRKVLLDRSIFHRTKFDLLKASNITDHVKKGKLRVYLTPMFIEETLMHGLNDKPEFVAHWDFIVSLIGQRWFRLAEEIVSIELGNKVVGPEYYLQPKNRVRQLIRTVRNFVNDKLSQKEFEETLAEVEQNEQTRQQFRKSRLELRGRVKPGDYDLDSYFESNVEWYIENLLVPYHHDSQNFLQTWRANRSQCVYTEQFVKAWFAAVLVPLRNHQTKVHKNDGADAEQLAFLTWADIMVSDDTRFMKEGFNLIWGNSQKKLKTLSEFLS